MDQQPFALLKKERNQRLKFYPKLLELRSYIMYILTIITSYYMSSFQLPKNICHKIEAKLRYSDISSRDTTPQTPPPPTPQITISTSGHRKLFVSQKLLEVLALEALNQQWVGLGYTQKC